MGVVRKRLDELIEKRSDGDRSLIPGGANISEMYPVAVLEDISEKLGNIDKKLDKVIECYQKETTGGSSTKSSTKSGKKQSGTAKRSQNGKKTGSK